MRAALLVAIASVGAQQAEKAQLAPRSLLLDVAAAGPRFVAVGERGHILFSDDRGQSWRQADDVPTQALLTAVCFSDARRGVAVGHDQVILTTQDAGRTWQRIHYAPESQQPLLDVWCDSKGRAIAIGAYASYFSSEDHGGNWVERKFEPQPAPDNDYHLNRIVAASPMRFYIAAEAGHLYRSDDAGATWLTLPSPYEGSFFGVLPLGGDEVLICGLRGHVFKSHDAGKSWRSADTGTVALLDDAIRMPDGRIVILGLSGTVLMSTNGGVSYTLMQQGDRKGLSAGLPAAPGTLVTVGEAGARRIELSY